MAPDIGYGSQNDYPTIFEAIPPCYTDDTSHLRTILLSVLYFNVPRDVYIHSANLPYRFIVSTV
jgi:hypothetical protein